MLHFDVMHAPDDDLAPLDYSYAPSVGEGVRRERAQKMHREPASDSLAQARPPLSAPQRLGPAPSAPQEDYGIPDNPFQPSEESQRPTRRSRAVRAAEPAEPLQEAAPAPAAPQRTGTGARTAMPVMTAADGSQFEAPASPEVPDWLRVAQQNTMPAHRPQAPRVQAAPQREEPPAPEPTDVLGRPLHNRRNIAAARAPQSASAAYEQAGYPEQLLHDQRRLEAEAAATPVRRRHGAQYAVRPRYAPEPLRQESSPYVRQDAQDPYTEPNPYAVQPSQEALMSRAYHRPKREEPQDAYPYRVEDDEPEERAGLAFRIPWLGIAAFAAALAAVILWIMQNSYMNQTQLVLDERAAQEQAIWEAHPLQYTEIISDKANKYNLHPAFVAAIMLNESSFRPDATSSVDARGLMQLMDDTASWIYGKLEDTGRPYDFNDLYDPEINAEYGCWYLNYLSDLFYGDPILVAAAFHAGQGEVRNWLNDSTYSRDGRTLRIEDMIDGPTKRYVTRVLNDYAAYKRLYFGG